MTPEQIIDVLIRRKIHAQKRAEDAYTDEEHYRALGVVEEIEEILEEINE